MTDDDRLPNPATRTEGEGETLDMPEGMQGFAPGQVLGERYQILEMLGRGGMGEVWHAFDLKLRVEVALKALRGDLFKSERRLELLRQEVRAAREVVSPNVCRIFDLIEVEGRELVSMEYVDGATLLGVLQERGPLELKEAQDIASQFLAGLEAIHKVGLIHRDIKPENIMLTRAGRVVVMDFGLARQETEGGGSVSGTPAYMAPEQAAGQTVDARADVYAAGVVLAEMVSPEGIKSYESRQSVWEGVRSEPAKLPDSPWAPAIKKAVAKDRAGRYNSAHTLTRALEDVTLRVEGAEDLHPYPGLASFTEEDAEYFFGREAEVEQMWRKLERPHLLGIVGPSGAGKTSFIRAGVIPNAGSGWAIATCNPGNAAFLSLGRALIPELSGDTDAMEALLQPENLDGMVSAVASWRRHHEQALLIVDQFEELFTQNPAETQARFAELLGRLVLEADVFVLLSMRDDFFFHCHQFEALKPVVTDLTLLGPPAGAALRRALVQPAMKCGYRFEDDKLVEEMLAEVEGERGALPLLAFASARLWENRDRKNGLLTRQAYEDIGGVGGALARHAEATLEKIGIERLPIVRELFRNLVTAEGTRAVREWDDLLSIFSDSQSESPEEVLRELIDARLLTSYEVREEDKEQTTRVEIIHESLLANWPRLVRWQTRDTEGAQLRDDLRQAARAWDEHGRQDDRLWTGTAYREYQLWRERYPGGLTETEEAFGLAMTSLATRQKRRRRLTAAVGLAILLAVLAVVTGLWRHSVQQTRRAEAETNRAEASKFLTLGGFALEEERTEALAYSIASLELADTPEARRLALRALWAGPPATVLPTGGRSWGVAFSPDGGYLAVGYWDGLFRVFPRDGGPPVDLHGYEGEGTVRWPQFSPDGRHITAFASGAAGEIHVWETEDWQRVRTFQVPGVQAAFGLFESNNERVLTVGIKSKKPPAGQLIVQALWRVHRWVLDGRPPQLLGSVEGTYPPAASLDLSRGLIAVGNRDEVQLHRLDMLGRRPGRVIARHPDLFSQINIPAFDPDRERLALADNAGHLYLWPLDGDGSGPDRVFEASGEPFQTVFSTNGELLALAAVPSGAWLWNLRDPAGTEPIRFDPTGIQMNGVAFSSDDAWMVTSGQTSLGLALWPLSGRYSRILGCAEENVERMAFSSDGELLFTQGGENGTIRARRISDGAGLDPEVVFAIARQWGWGFTVDPLGRYIVSNFQSETWKIPLDGGTPTVLEGLPGHPEGPVCDPEGRLLASNVWRKGYTPTMVVLDLETGERLEFDPPGENNVTSWEFDPSGRLLMARGGVLSRWDPSTRSTEVLTDEVLTDNGDFWATPSPDGRHVAAISSQGLASIFDVQNRTATTLPSRTGLTSVAFDPSGSILVTGHPDGEIRVGTIFDEEPQLLLGHTTPVIEIRVSPKGRWIASRDQNRTIRLWPMPDLSKPPLHTLPHEELVAKLKSLANLRAVPDEESYTGYTIEPDFTAYRGWAEVPKW